MVCFSFKYAIPSYFIITVLYLLFSLFHMYLCFNSYLVFNFYGFEFSCWQLYVWFSFLKQHLFVFLCIRAFRDLHFRTNSTTPTGLLVKVSSNTEYYVFSCYCIITSFDWLLWYIKQLIIIFYFPLSLPILLSLFHLHGGHKLHRIF